MGVYKFWRWIRGGRWINNAGSWYRVEPEKYYLLDNIEKNRVFAWPYTEDHRWFRERPYKTGTIFETDDVKVTTHSNGSTLLAVKGLGGWNVTNLCPYDLQRLGEALLKRGKEFDPEPFMGL